MPLQPGERLGPYEIVALLAVGGMGEVYRGRDPRLGREVALKVISPRVVGDPSFRRRFETEARAASVLNHPAIVTIYDVGDSAGVAWIAMEWVEGQTLRQVMAKGPLPLHQVLTLARQIAEGLAAAHAKGVVHRDLKPENVMLADGRSKILDFGLARQTLAEALEGPISHAETRAAPSPGETREGMILGTVGYMSPEQAAGRAADFRSDQFSLGLVLYEMLAGRRAFARGTAVETLSAVIREEPVPLASLRGGIPLPLLALVATCLAKRPEDRFSSTREIAAALEALGTASSASLETPTEMIVRSGSVRSEGVRPRYRPSPRTALVLGIALLLGVLVTGTARLWPKAPPTAIQSLAVLPFANTGGDADAEYLGDGLTESLIDQMSRVPALKVMARATVFRFKGAADPQEAGRALGVGAVLTGTVSRRGERLEISAELVDISTGARLWGERYDRPFVDLIRVQDSIAADIAEALRLRLSGAEKRTLVLHGTEDPEAYALYLKARHLLVAESEEADLEALRLFQAAAAKDPKFVNAHLGVNSIYARRVGMGFIPPAEAWTLMQAELQKVLALDPGNVEVRNAVASRRFLHDWDWARADREFRELRTEPQLLNGTQWHPIAMYYWARGQPDQSVAIVERALTVDPGNLESRIMRADFAAQAGQLDQAIGHYRDLTAAEPSDSRPWFGLAEVLKRRGDVSGAIEALRKAYELSEEEDGVRALAGARTEKDYEKAELAVARVRLVNLEAMARERYISPLDLARLYAQVGDRDRAFAQLEAAVAERSMGLVMLKVDRAWDRIRDDPRFTAIVLEVGIP